MSRGTIFLVGGINDTFFVRYHWPKGLAGAGLTHDIRSFAWQQGFWAALTFADLWNTKHHHRSAEQLADDIRAVRTADPDAPVHVLSHSAGTAITAYALERLSADECVTSAALVSSGLSPDYDLSAAISRCSAGLLAVTSPLDFWVLGIGTTLLGTVDRKHRPAAGAAGFRTPSDPEAMAKLTHVRWSPDQVKHGWVGGHLNTTSAGFAGRMLAGWVRHTESGAVGQFPPPIDVADG